MKMFLTRHSSRMLLTTRAIPAVLLIALIVFASCYTLLPKAKASPIQAWTKYLQNPVLHIGAPGDWDDLRVATLIQPAALDEQKVVVLLMKFQDIVYEPNTPSHYSDLIFGSMNAYYIENSFNQFSVTGSVFGWYVLPHPKSYYVDSGGSGNALEMLKDSVATADPYVDFREFKHIIMVFNGLFTPGGAPGWNVQTADGIVNVGVVFVPDINAETDPDPMGCYAHEFGHALGLPHSNSGHWDCMSGGPELGGYNGPNCSFPAHFISFGKIQLGWLPSRRVNVISSGQAIFDIFNLETTTTGYQAAKIPISSTTYYLIETRKRVGYDTYLPSQGVLISYVDETQGSYPSSLIDAKLGTSTLDDAAWQMGQTFIDSAFQISVSILTGTPDLFRVQITINPRPPPVIDSVDENGNIKNTFDCTLNEKIYVKGSNFPPATTFKLYVVRDGAEINPANSLRDKVRTITSDSFGNIPITEVGLISTVGKYDLWADVNDNGVNDPDDVVKYVEAGKSEIIVIPEFHASTILLVALLFVMFLWKLELRVQRREQDRPKAKTN